MAQFFDELLDKHMRFIEKQKMFFVATADADGRINLSPKGLDSFKILNPKTVAWLNLTGSGNESAAHILKNPRMTIMMCSFDKNPLILRIYAKTRAVHPGDKEWSELISHFEDRVSSRQIFVCEVDSVQTSCGYAVPFYEFQGHRDTLDVLSDKKGKEGIQDYWATKNTTSIDGLDTGMTTALKNLPQK